MKNGDDEKTIVFHSITETMKNTQRQIDFNVAKGEEREINQIEHKFKNLKITVIVPPESCPFLSLNASFPHKSLSNPLNMAPTTKTVVKNQGSSQYGVANATGIEL